MKHILAFTYVAILLAGAALGASEIPAQPAARVNDLVGILSQDEARQLEGLLEAYERESSNQLVLLVVDSLGGDSIENVALRTFEKWKLGTKENKNGILLLVALQDRRVRIEVGYGLEGRLTDAISSSIVRNTITPAFREQRYYAGIRAGFEQIVAATRGEYAASQRQPQRNSPTGMGIGVMLLFFLIMMIVGGLASRANAAATRRGRTYWTGGSGGFSGGFWDLGGGGGGSSWGGGGFSGFSGGGGSSGGGGASGSW